MMIHRLAFVLGLMVCLVASSCNEIVVYRDFDVEFEDSSFSFDFSGSSELIIGVYHEQLFNDLSTGDPVHIINGLQGGTWVHISIRVVGMPTIGSIAVSLGDVGDVEFDVKLVRSAEGYLEAYDIPIPIPLEGEDLEQLFGQDATLSVFYTSEEQTVSSELLVVMEKG